MHYMTGRVASADGQLTNALKRIRRRLARRPWEMDGGGRIRCELLPPVAGHPRRMCCPLGMLAAEAPHARLDRTLRDRTNAEWRAAVVAFVDLELRNHTLALRQQPDRQVQREYTERDLVRLGVGLAVSTTPSDRVCASILAMEPATIQLLSEATDCPDTHAGILLVRALRTEGNTLAEDFRTHFRKTVEEAAAAWRTAAAIQRRRLQRPRVDVQDESERGSTSRRAQGGAGLSAAAISFGAGVWRILGGR